MNKNQIHGMATDLVGQVQEKTGQIIGNPSQELKGVQKQISGKAEEKLVDVKEAVKNVHDAMAAAVKAL